MANSSFWVSSCVGKPFDFTTASAAWLALELGTVPGKSIGHNLNIVYVIHRASHDIRPIHCQSHNFIFLTLAEESPPPPPPPQNE